MHKKQLSATLKRELGVPRPAVEGLGYLGYLGFGIFRAQGL